MYAASKLVGLAAQHHTKTTYLRGHLARGWLMLALGGLPVTSLLGQELHPGLQDTLDTVQDFDAFLDMITADYSGTIERRALWRGALAGMAEALGPGCHYHPPGWRDDTPDVLQQAKTERINASTWRLLGLHPDDPVARLHHRVGDTLSLERCAEIKAVLTNATNNEPQSAGPDLQQSGMPADLATANLAPVNLTKAPQALEPMHYAGVVELSKTTHPTGAQIAFIRLATLDGSDTTPQSQHQTMHWLAPWLQDNEDLRAAIIDLRLLGAFAQRGRGLGRYAAARPPAPCYCHHRFSRTEHQPRPTLGGAGWDTMPNIP